MFHTLFDPESQNIDFNVQAQKNDIKSRFKYGTENEQYFGKGNQAIDQFNKRKNYIKRMKELNPKYSKSKTKVKIVVYKNGFILNNGEFRDKIFEENKRFLDEVNKGNIPQELMKKGIMDLEILLENRKNEIYHSPFYQSINTSIYNTNTFQNSYLYQYRADDSDILSLLYNDSNNYNTSNINNGINWESSNITSTYIPNSIPQINTQRNMTLYSSKTMKVNNGIRAQKNNNKNNSHKKEKKVVDFLDFKKEEDAKKDKKEKNEKNEKKKFTAFSGFGQLLGNINTQGLHIDKNVKTSVNCFDPICHVNIRLFNGEIIKSPFNYSHTVGDIYIYVRKVSGSDNFVLLDGFPPKPITDYGKSIGELRLYNSVITQKIN